jgi:hypothetical protein
MEAAAQGSMDAVQQLLAAKADPCGNVVRALHGRHAATYRACTWFCRVSKRCCCPAWLVVMALGPWRARLTNSPPRGLQDGTTPIHLASKYGHTEVLQLLLDQPGAELGAANAEGKTPLAMACSQPRGNDAVLDMLIARGAAVTSTDKVW